MSVLWQCPGYAEATASDGNGEATQQADVDAQKAAEIEAAKVQARKAQELRQQLLADAQKALGKGDTAAASMLIAYADTLGLPDTDEVKKADQQNAGKNSENTNSECQSESCDQDVVDAAGRIGDLADKAKEEAAKGDTNALKAILSKMDGVVADSVPADIGWGDGTRTDETVLRAMCRDRPTVGEGKQNAFCVSLLKEKYNAKKPDDFFIGLYAGVEGASVKRVKDDKATARVGINFYNQFSRFQPSFSDDTLGIFKSLTQGDHKNDLTQGPKSQEVKALGLVNRLNSRMGNLDTGTTDAGQQETNAAQFVRARCGGTLNCGFGFGLHGWANLLFTTTAEGSGQEDDNDNGGTMASEDTEDASVESTIELELGTFVPVFQKYPDHRGHLLLGPTAFWSVRGLEGGERLTKRYYGGLRAAYSPESWFDLVYGKTEGLNGRRMEARLQAPIYKLSADSRLLLGFVANVGVKDSEDTPDSFRLYVTWNTGAKGLFGG